MRNATVRVTAMVMVWCRGPVFRPSYGDDDSNSSSQQRASRIERDLEQFKWLRNLIRQ